MLPKKRIAAIKILASAWSSLEAWRPVDMRSVKVIVKARNNKRKIKSSIVAGITAGIPATIEPQSCYSTGLATTHRDHGQAEVIVRLGFDEADGLATLLHELAHVAAARRGHSGHDAGWQQIYRQAAKEVLGLKIPESRSNWVGKVRTFTNSLLRSICKSGTQCNFHSKGGQPGMSCGIDAPSREEKW